MLKVWEEYVVPQIQKGKLEVPEKFDFTAYLKTMDTILDFPINKRIDRVELELYTYLDLYPEIEKKIWSNAAEIFIGSHPIGSINASVLECSEKKFLILLNEGLINFVQAVTTWCISAIYEVEKQDGNLDKLRHSIRNKAAVYLKGYKEQSVLIEDYTLQPSPEELYLINRITNGSLKFAIAHELGHIANDDFASEKFEKFNLAAYSVNRYTKTKEKEFEADKFAYHLLHKINKNYATDVDLEFQISGILMLFWSLDLLEWVEGNNRKSLTHPSIEDRGERIVSYIDKDLLHEFELPAQLEDIFNWIFEDFSIN